jgi:hypothetical protein
MLFADIDPPVFVGRQRAAACTLEELAEQRPEDAIRRRLKLAFPLTIEPTQLDASVSKKPLGGDCGCRARSIQEVLFEGEGRLTTAARAQIPRRK